MNYYISLNSRQVWRHFYYYFLSLWLALHCSITHCFRMQRTVGLQRCLTIVMTANRPVLVLYHNLCTIFYQNIFLLLTLELWLYFVLLLY